jgi:Zn-dependent protease
MTGYLTGFLLKVALLAPPILLALTVHEASHALVANLRGDDTARRAGRLSLNPLRHLDPAGTLVFFITAWVGSGIGWAKPVPVDYRRLLNPRRDVIWISAAGPAANLACALILALILRLMINNGLFQGPSLITYYLGQAIIIGVQVNTILACFNLLPLPPLDGSGILLGLLPLPMAARYQAFGRYGFAILLGLIFLPQVISGFPDVIGTLVVWPARQIMAALLPL